MKVLIGFIMLILCLTSCDFSLTGNCNNEIKQEVKSPDSKYIATWFVRDCGATTDFSTLVSLRLSLVKFNVDKEKVFVVRGQPQLSVIWNGNTNLQIKYSECSSEDIFKREKLWNNVSISY